MPSSVSASSGVSSLPNHPPAVSNHRSVQVLLIHDKMTFDTRQAIRLRDMERQMETELKRKKRNFEREVEQMREEFIKLFPVDRVWGSDELLADPLVARRRGSTDVLNPRRMKTMYSTTPESETRFQLRFDLTGFIPASIQVTGDSDRIIVRAIKYEQLPENSACPILSVTAPSNGGGAVSCCTAPVYSVSPEDGATESAGGEPSGTFVWKEYSRKIEKPRDVDHTKLKARLSSDGILLIQATMASQSTIYMSKSDSLPTKATPGPSPSTSFQSSTSNVGSSRPKSPKAGTAAAACQGSPEMTPSSLKLGVPIFREELGTPGCRRMHLAVDVGTAFKPKEITVQALKDNRILIKGKHEERTSDRLSKNKYSKEFELPEKINTHTIRGGLCADGVLIIGAFVKGHGGVDPGKDEGTALASNHVLIESLDRNAGLMPCNVLDLASFPPKMSSSASAVSIHNHANV